MKRILKNNPIVVVAILLLSIATLITYSRNIEVISNSNKGFFSGRITFEESYKHTIYSDKVEVKKGIERGLKTLAIAIIDEKTSESVFVKLYDVQEKGTFFIPGEGKVQNIGNLIKNVNHFRELNNFYQTTLVNEEGLKNGVGRVNITKLTDTEIEGELIIIGNNSEGKQAQLESARFKAKI
ncbi:MULTISPECIES: hypothetical protein [unclassified Arcicella]|uniref:hypothetical protein n=1 Tax=unclassified Arcicella TaxID=2644986 RepID=UPI0028547B25|nr:MULTISPECIES: hypothetical protein [unclassified Arcicella]MDR6563348.1 hypothetical protein [Arcicella sp. BE51]MDR6813231.1 hypothetical protein [Arcicella sp. BE140]MDR6824545.1 hypothetical protein [Arcicella sp. BE139]